MIHAPVVVFTAHHLFRNLKIRLHPNGRLLELPANIRLGHKLMAVTTTLTYFNMATILSICFIVQPQKPILSRNFGVNVLSLL
jgi:hypothetical protein